MITRTNKLLLAHEDIEFVDTLFRSLVSDGFRVGLTTCSETALQILKEHDFGVVVVSASMRFGVETKLFEVLQYRYPQLPVVLLTDGDVGEEGRELATAEVFAYLVKPFDTHQISALSHVAIDRGLLARAQAL